MKRSLMLMCVCLLVAWNESPSARFQDVSGQGARYSVRTWPLPDNNTGDVSMDYIAYDPGTNSVWVPGGNSAAVDVVDGTTGRVRQIADLPTREVEVRGGKRVLGPSAVSIGDGVVYIGNRADATICAFNRASLARVTCGSLDSTPDGVVFVAPTKEVWVTTPGDKSIRVLDAKTLQQKTKLTFEGRPEGYAVDVKHNRFYTNLEDKDRTLAIDVKTHMTVATWNPSCGKDGPHGLAVDARAQQVFVACSTLAEVLDAGHNGAVVSRIETGDGVDDIHYVPTTHLLYVGAARAAKLTIARVDDQGHLSVVVQVPTREGARNAVVGKDGTVFLAHSGLTKLSALIVALPDAK